MLYTFKQFSSCSRDAGTFSPSTQNALITHQGTAGDGADPMPHSHTACCSRPLHHIPPDRVPVRRCARRRCATGRRTMAGRLALCGALPGRATCWVASAAAAASMVSTAGSSEACSMVLLEVNTHCQWTVPCGSVLASRMSCQASCSSRDPRKRKQAPHTSAWPRLSWCWIAHRGGSRSTTSPLEKARVA